MFCWRKLMAAVLVLVLCAAVATTPVFAEEAEQDGLRVELTVSPEECASGDTVSAALAVTNRGSAAVVDLRMELVLPEGWSLSEGAQRTKEIQRLESGETAVLETELFAGLPAAAEQSKVQPQMNRAEREGPDDVHIGIGGSVLAGILLMLGKNLLGGRRMMSLALCGAMLCGMFTWLPGQVQADSGHWLDSLTVQTTVSVDGQPVQLCGRVTYRLEEIEETPPSAPLVLEADTSYFVAGVDSQVTFRTEAGVDAGAVSLFCDGELAAAMHDDGTVGDAVANDGIYTCTIPAVYSGEEQEQFHAEAGAQTSNRVTLYYFQQLDEEAASRAEDVLKSISADLQEIEDRFADENGFVPSGQVDAVLDAVQAYLMERSQSGEILLWEVDDVGAYIKLTSGLTLMYEPALEGVSAPGAEVTLSFIAFQPHPDINSDTFDMLTEYLAENVPGESKSFANAQVTLELVKSFGPNQIIFWNGHGGYGPIVKSYLASGEYFDWGAWWFDIGYYLDCIQDRIINRSSPEQNELACFTHKFISHYCGDLSGDLVFLGSCHSGQNDKLANAFLNKGAETVVGFTDTVYTGYCNAVVVDSALTMSTPKLETGNYYTISEALDRAIRKYGANDLEFARSRPEIFTNLKSQAAEPVIFGDRDYRYRQTEIGTIIGRVCDAVDRTVSVPGAQIILGWDGFDQWTATSDEQGEYIVEIPAEYYPITVRAPGYLDFTAYTQVHGGENTYLETYLLVAQSEETEGTATGVISNALTGEGIGGVRIRVHSGWNNTGSEEALAETATDDNGQYALTLPLGNYTLELNRDGFVNSVLNIVVVGGGCGPQNGSMTPSVAGDDYRIVLSWTAQPRDLDSHVSCSMPTGSGYHVYYRQKTHREGERDVCTLDLDDTNGWGPETVTLHTEASADYCYYVHRYAGSGTIADSGAQIRISQGGSEIAVVNVPTDQGGGDYWNVLAIRNGELTIVNTITAEPELP